MSKEEIDIYGIGKIVESVIKRINNSKELTENNKADILKFMDFCHAEGLSISRIRIYLEMMHNLGRWIGKDFRDCQRPDIEKVVEQIEKSKYSYWTKHDYKVSLKKFYRWLRNTEKPLYPPEVSWLKTTKNCSSHKLPDELLTEDDIKKLVDSCDSLRNKALILSLYESGCRVGEILTMRVRNVEFDRYGATLIVNGKTGSRRVRIIVSAPVLSSWIENHPLKDADSPLWVNEGVRNKGKAMTYHTIMSLLQRTFKRSGLNKNSNPHLFRHSRATILANKLTEAQMDEYFGWTQGSKMASTYVHLSGRNLDNALLKIHGIELEKEGNDKEVLTNVECPRCRINNSSTSKFCYKCGLALDMGVAMEVEREARQRNEMLNDILKKRPEIVEILAEIVLEIEKGKKTQ